MLHSTGYRNNYYTKTVVTPGLFDGGAINLYSGAAPGTADAAPTGTLLCAITLPTPCFAAPSGGVITANTITGGTVLATGVIGYGRVVTATDGGGLSTTDPRYQFSVGVSGTEMIVNTASVVLGGTQTVTSFTVTAPL